MELIKLFVIFIVIISLNFIFKSKNFLLSYTGLKHQVYIQRNKVPLSGGFILLIHFLLNHNDQNIILIFYIFLFFLIGLIGDLNLFKTATLRLMIQILTIIFFVASLNISIIDLRFSFLNEPITAFFETVKVNDDDSKMRGNRLNLLSLVCKKIELIADFKKIER